MSPRSPLSAPPRRLQVMEGLWPWEALAFQLHPPPGCLLPVAAARPVLVLPGFTAGDGSTLPLRQLLRRHGHYAHAWRLGRNIGPTPRAVYGMRALLGRLADRHGTPVTLVGWSLGGVYARALAREQPHLVEQVITLGSPFRFERADRGSAQMWWNRVTPLHVQDLVTADIAEEARPALTVPATAIYTRYDGVVRWQACVDEAGPGARNPRAENVEVFGTHSGLGVNSAAAFVILDRLANAGGEWRPFRPPLAIRGWYPRPLAAAAA